MNRTSARLTRTLLAVTVLSLGATACSGATSTAPPTVGLSTTSSPTTTSPPTTLSTTETATPTSDGASKAGSGNSSTACTTEHEWGTAPVFGSIAMSPSPLYLTRVGQHACYDRVVFDINGPEAVGFAARYVPVVLADASGKPVPVAGHAALQVTVRAPILGTGNQGHQPGVTAPAVGESLVAPAKIAGWSSLRAVTFAGSFEGLTAVAVGVREKLPFRMFVSSAGTYQHVVLDISH
ncbi:MAG: hypothetical protein ABI903_16780 [Actinomycetota bacterium]